MKNVDFTKPLPGEYADYYGGYISLVKHGSVIETLENEILESANTLGSVSDEKSRFRYAEGKWSLGEVVGHLIDTERVMAYRALVFARGDKAELPGMDQDEYVAHANYDARSITDMTAEFVALRKANVHFFKALPDESWTNGGIASGAQFSVRALASIIAGHEIHHMSIIRDRYLG